MPESAQSVASPEVVGASPQPLAPILVIVWLCSLGTAVIWQGIFFIAREVYEFGVIANYLLAIVGGVSYVAAALTAGPMIRKLGAGNKGPSPRGILLGVMALLIAACVMPGFVTAPWSLWAFILIYSPLTGWLWPLCEAYIASGRSGRDLVRATGRFNIAWAGAIPVALWSMGPVLKFNPLLAFQLLAFIHLACLPLVALLARAPADHGAPEVDHELEDVAKARSLLLTFRVLNSSSYVLISLLLPVLPLAMVRMEIPVEWRTPLLSIWVVVRIGMFILLERWHGWHGRWRTTVWSGTGLLLGFALAYFAMSPVTLGIGLALIGIGAGGVYSGAIFYAMDVGKAEIDAGGKHEAILGSGYLAGPAIGMAIEVFKRAAGD